MHQKKAGIGKRVPNSKSKLSTPQTLCAYGCVCVCVCVCVFVCVPQQNHLHITQNTCIFSGDRSVVLLYSQTHRASLKVQSVEMSMFLVELQH